MIPWIPKEIEGKITFTHGDVKVKEGVKLSEEEKKIFDEFRTHIVWERDCGKFLNSTIVKRVI